MTALLRLIEQLEGEDSKIARVIGLKKYNSIIKEALQEEKEQIIMAYKADLHPCSDEDAEDYYKKTFKTK